VTDEHVLALDDVPDGGTAVFRVRVHDGGAVPDVEEGEVDEAFVVRDGDAAYAYVNRCQHWTDVRLDTGDGARTRDGEIICQKHGAYFEGDTGYCNYGPCEGSYLPRVEIDVRDGDVYLVDDGYGFEGVGPLEEDGDDAPGGTRGGDDFEL